MFSNIDVRVQNLRQLVFCFSKSSLRWVSVFARHVRWTAVLNHFHVPKRTFERYRKLFECEHFTVSTQTFRHLCAQSWGINWETQCGVAKWRSRVPPAVNMFTVHCSLSTILPLEKHVYSASKFVEVFYVNLGFPQFECLKINSIQCYLIISEISKILISKIQIYPSCTHLLAMKLQWHTGTYETILAA